MKKGGRHVSIRSLVTGGQGFIGRRLVHLLKGRGERVRVLDIAPPGGVGGVNYIQDTILDRAAVRRAMRGVDRVYHLAAKPELWTPDKRDFYRVNHLGSRIVLDEAGRAGVSRIVYTSTESILRGVRRQRGRRLLDETVAAGLDDMPGPYCRSKFLGEQEARAAARRGLPVVIVNPTLPVGPGDTRLTPPTRMILGFLNGTLPAYLDCELNLVDVRDAALGHVLAAERGRVGERYILGGENLPVSQLLDLLAGLTGLRMARLRVPYAVAFVTGLVSEAVADFVTRRPPAAPLTGVRLARLPSVFDCSKAVRELGFPRRRIRDSLADAIVWLERQGLLTRAPRKRPAPAGRTTRPAPS